MAIPVINYSAQTPQGSPLGQGLLPAIQQGLNLGYAPAEKKAALERSRLENALRDLQLEYAPQKNEQELLRSQLENQYYSQDMESQIAAREAGTEYKGEQTRHLPLSNALQVANTLRANSRFGHDYQLTKFLNNLEPSARAAWIADNQEKYTNLINNMASQVGRELPGETFLTQALQNYEQGGMQGQNQRIPTRQTQGMSQRQPQDYALNLSEGQEQNLIDSGMATRGAGGAATQAPFYAGQNFQENFQSTPEQVDRMQLAAQIAANKSLTTTGTQSQLEGAIQVADVMNNPDFRKKAVNAAEYAGIIGKGKAAVAAFSKDRPESYQDYLSFVNHDMMLLQNRIKALDGMGSSESQMKELHGLYNNTMDLMTSNPKQFIKQLDRLGSALDTVAESVELSANPLGYPSRIKPYENIGAQENKRSGSTYNRQTGEFE